MSFTGTPLNSECRDKFEEMDRYYQTKWSEWASKRTFELSVNILALTEENQMLREKIKELSGN